MRQAITTKYIGPSNARGSRIKAIARKADPARGWKEMSLTKPYQHGSSEQEHCETARLLAEKLGWSGLWIGGGNVDETGYVYVNAGEPSKVHAIVYCVPSLREGADWFYVAPVEPA